MRRMHIARGFALVATIAVLAVAGTGASLAQSTTPPPSEYAPPTAEPARSASSDAQEAAADARGFVAPKLVQADLSYMTIPGVAFRPRGSAQQFYYDGNGCLRLGTNPPYNNDSYLAYAAILPDFSMLSQVRVFYKNPPAGSGSTGYAYFTRFDATGQSSLVDLFPTPVETGGAAGYGSSLSVQVPSSVAQVDSYLYSYVLSYYPASYEQSLCGMRIAYYAPVFAFASFLPIANRSSNIPLR